MRIKDLRYKLKNSARFLFASFQYSSGKMVKATVSVSIVTPSASSNLSSLSRTEAVSFGRPCSENPVIEIESGQISVVPEDKSFKNTSPQAKDRSSRSTMNEHALCLIIKVLHV